jgi:hypothetical protein
VPFDCDSAFRSLLAIAVFAEETHSADLRFFSSSRTRAARS